MHSDVSSSCRKPDLDMFDLMKHIGVLRNFPESNMGKSKCFFISIPARFLDVSTHAIVLLVEVNVFLRRKILKHVNYLELETVIALSVVMLYEACY